MQQDLFGEKVTDLVTVKSVKKYSKEQVEFQKLCEKIDSAKSSLSDLKIKLDNLLSEYNSKVVPTEKIRNQSIFKVLKAIDSTYQKFKLSGRTKEMMQEMMMEMLLDIAFDFSKHEEFDLLYDKYKQSTDDEIEDDDFIEEDFEHTEEEFEFMKKNVEEMAYQTFGLRLDLSDIEHGPDFDEQIAARLDAAMANRGFEKNNQQGAKSKPRKKTKKQLEKEEAAKALEDIKDKSLKTIYVSLAKALHPDLEQDEDQKLVKQELMKLVTIAYRNNDLQELLNLQLKWVNNESNHIYTLSVNQLKVYIQLLKEKLSMCLDEKNTLLFNPKYQKVRNFLDYTNAKSFNTMDKKLLEIEKEIKDLNDLEIKILKTKTGKLIKDFVEEQFNHFDSQFTRNAFQW